MKYISVQDWNDLLLYLKTTMLGSSFNKRHTKKQCSPLAAGHHTLWCNPSKWFPHTWWQQSDLPAGKHWKPILVKQDGVICDQISKDPQTDLANLFNHYEWHWRGNNFTICFCCIIKETPTCLVIKMSHCYWGWACACLLPSGVCLAAYNFILAF